MSSSHTGLELVVIGALAVLLLFGGKACSEFKCEEVESYSNIKTKFSWWSGCYVKVDGRWIPQDSWRGEYEQGRQPPPRRQPEPEHVIEMEEQVIER